MPKAKEVGRDVVADQAPTGWTTLSFDPGRLAHYGPLTVRAIRAPVPISSPS